MWNLLAQSVPSQLNAEQVGLFLFCIIAIIAAIAGSLGVVILWQKITKSEAKDTVVTLAVLDNKIQESESRLAGKIAEFERRLTSQLNKLETHEGKLEEYKHETRRLLLESTHKVELQLAKLTDSTERFNDTDLTLFVKREEFDTKLLEFKDHRAYTHQQIHDIRDILQELRIKMEVLIAQTSSRIDPRKSNPDFKLPPEAGGES